MTKKRYYVNSAGYLCDMDLSNTLSIFECADKLNELLEENEQLKKENEKLHSKIFEMRTNEALERTEISKQSYDGYKTAKEFLKELEKW